MSGGESPQGYVVSESEEGVARGYDFGPNAEAGPSRSPLSRDRSAPVVSMSRTPSRYPESRSASRSRSPAPSSSGLSASGSEYEDRNPSKDRRRKVRRRRSADYNMGTPSEQQIEPQGVEWYISDLGRHIKWSAAALEGRILRGDGHVYAGTHYDTTAVPPSQSLWTSEEKNLFFAAISRHSRLRTDLIAADVRSKSEAQVVEYLSILEYEAAHVSDRKGEGEESRTWREHALWTGVYKVDRSFVQQEDRLAEVVEERAQEAMPRPRRRKSISNDAQLEEWGQRLDIAKLTALSSVTRASEVTEKDDLERASHSGDDDEDDPIAKDDKAIAALQEIQKNARTPSQKQRLRTLLNRRASRQRSRLKTLYRMGFTEAQVEEGGGPDVMYASELKRGSKMGAPRKPHSELKMRDADAEALRLVDLGADAYLTQRGLEIFNYSRVAEMLEDSRHDYAAMVEDSAAGAAADVEVNGIDGTSFTLISDLYMELLAYLKPLVYTTIMVAEQQLSQIDGSSIGVHQVLATLGLRGELAKLRDTSGKVIRRERQATEMAEGQDPLSPGVLTSHGSKRSASVPQELSWTAASAAPLSDGEQDSDSLCEYKGGETDGEDEKLDTALDKADTALDAVLAAELTTTLEDNDPRVAVDEGYWAHPPERGTKRKRRPRHVAERLVADLDAAQDQYRSLSLEIHDARRRRAKIQSRSDKWPRTKLIRLTRCKMEKRMPPDTVQDIWTSGSESDDWIASGESSGALSDVDGRSGDDESEEEEEEEESRSDSEVRAKREYIDSRQSESVSVFDSAGTRTPMEMEDIKPAIDDEDESIPEESASGHRDSREISHRAESEAPTDEFDWD